MNYKLGFILGRETALSYAEVGAVLERENIEWREVIFRAPVLIVESENPKLSEIKIDLFGGVIKLFTIIGTVAKDDALATLEKLDLPQTEKRINFGLSYYHAKQSRVLGLKLKESFLAKGLKARHVTGKFDDLSSVIVHENKLVERGFEAIIIGKGKEYIIGRTLEVQDYKAYSKRDFGRPARDDRSGMLPPKLAKMMINLARVEKSESIYDPFCGSGTIVTEAYVLGYKNLFASDISAKSVADTRANLNWIEQFGSSKVENEKIFESDCLAPKKLLKVDAIIGEGYLGEPVRKTAETASRELESLTVFYRTALSNLSPMLNKNGRIVIAVPFYIVGSSRYYLPLEKILVNYELDYPKGVLGLSSRHTLTYSRTDQFVGREILCLKKSAKT